MSASDKEWERKLISKLTEGEALPLVPTQKFTDPADKIQEKLIALPNNTAKPPRKVLPSFEDVSKPSTSVSPHPDSKSTETTAMSLDEDSDCDQDVIESPNELHIQPEGWSVKDKEKLLKSLKFDGYSPDDLHALSEIIGKPEEDIKKAIEYYREKALYNVKCSAKAFTKPTRKRKKPEKNIPLVMWLKLLLEKFPVEELQTETSDALRLIAECEQFPEPPKINNIDFRAIYMFIADAMEGRVTSILNCESIKLLKKCLFEVALQCNSTQHFDHQGFIKLLQTRVHLELPQADVVSRSDPELQNLKFLTAQRAYNPFSVPDSLLQSYDTKIIGPV